MKNYIPYGRQTIDSDDIKAVEKVLLSDLLTTGSAVDQFEADISNYVGAKYAVAVSSGTAALHASMQAIGIKKGDEVIMPPMTFAATANSVVYQGGHPIFVDVEEDTLLLDPLKIEKKITRKTKAIVAVDYAGQPCNYKALSKIAKQYGLILISDACHSLGGEYRHQKVGTLADLTIFSFHPVKPITTGEGGMIVTKHRHFAKKMRAFRNHGIESDHRSRLKAGSWFYEMTELGYNYRITDFQCALGISQLKKLDKWVLRRQAIADQYDNAFQSEKDIHSLKSRDEISHGRHLYVVKIDSLNRQRIFTHLRKEGIGVNVHYIPVHLHPFYKKQFRTKKGLCPVAEKNYTQIISLPIFFSLKDTQVKRIIGTLKNFVTSLRSVNI